MHPRLSWFMGLRFVGGVGVGHGRVFGRVPVLVIGLGLGFGLGLGPGCTEDPPASVVECSIPCGPQGSCDETSGLCRCPDGEAGDGRHCRPVPVTCGDGVVDWEAGEQCDDGNRLAGDGCDPGCLSEAVAYADRVVEAPGDTGEGFFDARNAVNGVRGCGVGCGSQDVFSLGYAPGVNSHLVVRWSGRRVANGPGPDFVVFENAFAYGGSGKVFMDPMVVFLSRDGTDWVAFPHDYVAPDEEAYSPEPSHWQGFAGVSPVTLHEEKNPVDPFVPELAGGDAFDLDDLPEDGGEASAIRREGFRYLKLVSAHALTNPDTGAPYPKEAISDGPDVDGVYGRWLIPD